MKYFTIFLITVLSLSFQLFADDDRDEHGYDDDERYESHHEEHSRRLFSKATPSHSYRKISKGVNDWGHDSDYGKLFDPSTIEAIEGEIIEKNSFTPGQGMGSGLYLIVDDKKQNTYVHLGPVWFLADQSSFLKPGDHVSITGSKVIYRNEPTIIAQQVKKDTAILVLRNEQGFPVWGGWQKN